MGLDGLVAILLLAVIPALVAVLYVHLEPGLPNDLILVAGCEGCVLARQAGLLPKHLERAHGPLR